MKKNYFLILFSLIVTTTFSQVGINTTNPEAQLDIKSSNQALPTNKDGLLIPKIDAFPVTNPTVAQQGMLVYLTTTVGVNVPGFYYWNNSPDSWLPLKGINGGTLDQAYDFGGAGLGKTITADAGAVLINGTDGFVSTGTFNTGAIAPSGGGTKMFWNPKKAAFRAGLVGVSEWNDVNVGYYSAAFGQNTKASGDGSTVFGMSSTASGDGSTAFGNGNFAGGIVSTAFGNATVATGNYSTTFGNQTTASGDYSISTGLGTTASGILSTAFGDSTTASGNNSFSFGSLNIANGNFSTSFGKLNSAPSYAETVLGIGATTYTPTTNGATQFRSANTIDRLFVIGNAIDVNSNGSVDTTERSDAIIILKSGLTRLPSTTNAMITSSDGKAVVTKEYLQSTASGTLDQAYDFGGAGLGNTITADAGAVLINGTDGFVSTGTLNSGAIAPSGAGVKMFWNPRKAAFRAGFVFVNQWDDANVGDYSVAMGFGTKATGSSCIALGSNCSALGFGSVAFGWSTNANATQSTAFGIGNNANNLYSTAFGYSTITSGIASTSFGVSNETKSYGEVVLGIGATSYSPSINGASQFRMANATDRLFVIGNAIDLNNNDDVDTAERSDAIIVLKNGLTRLPSTTNAMITAADGKAVVTKEYLTSNGWGLEGNIGTNATTNFIGTTDNIDVVFKRNNFISGRIGTFNTSYGQDSQISITTGILNTANGVFANSDTTTGINNTSIGYNANGFNTTGRDNTANGAQALRNNITGNENSAFGQNANVANSNLTNTTAIGSNAMVSTNNSMVLGSISGVNGATNSVNVGIGTSSPQTKLEIVDDNAATTVVTEGNLNIYTNNPQAIDIGASITLGGSNNDAGTLFRTFASVEGRKSNSTTTNSAGYLIFKTTNTALTEKMRITNVGDVGIGTPTPGGQFELTLNEGRKPTSNTWIIPSDTRLKNVNGIYEKGLTDIVKLQPIRYNYKNTDKKIFENEVLSKEAYGFLAQEVQPIFPEAVGVDDDGYLNFDLHPILIASINALKELNLKNEALQLENKILKEQLEAQSKTINTILNRLENLENK